MLNTILVFIEISMLLRFLSLMLLLMLLYEFFIVFSHSTFSNDILIRCEMHIDDWNHVCHEDNHRLIAIVSPAYNSARCSLNV